MKNILAGCLLFFFSIAHTIAQAQEKDPDVLIQKLWTSVKNSDQDAYLRLFPGYEKTKTLLKSYYGNMKDSAAKKMFEKYLSELTEEKFQDEMMSRVKEQFSSFQVETRNKSIDLNAMRFDSSAYEILNTDEMTGVEIRTLKGTIYLKNDTTTYELAFSGSLWSESEQGWYGAILDRIGKKGENEDMGSVMPEEETVRDSSFTEVSKEPPLPPPPPPAKQVKKKTTTTKSSPARKTKTKS
jgi:hypothetical protein